MGRVINPDLAAAFRALRIHARHLLAAHPENLFSVNYIISLLLTLLYYTEPAVQPVNFTVNFSVS